MSTLDFTRVIECTACGSDCGWDGRVRHDPSHGWLRRGLVFLCPVCLNAGAVFGGHSHFRRGETLLRPVPQNPGPTSCDNFLFYFFNLPKFSPKKKLPFPISMPDDFRIELRYSNGSLPPPEHYEYRVRCYGNGKGGKGRGVIWFFPDYPGVVSEETGESDVDCWKETFEVKREAMEDLYALMRAFEIFQPRPTPVSPPERPTGGETFGLDILFGKHRFTLPPETLWRGDLLRIRGWFENLIPYTVMRDLVGRQKIK